MPSARRKTNKSGAVFYEIRVSRGRSRSYLTRRWYPPEGWSKKAIDRELARVAAEFEREAQAGEVISRAEKRQQQAQEAAEAAKIQTLRQYGERVFMPAKTVTMSENSRSTYQGNLDNWIYPALGDLKMPEVTSAQITALLNSLFKMAYLADAIPRNPMDKVARPKPRKGEAKPKEPEAYTAQEVGEILAALEKEPLKWRAFIRLLIDTGVRRGEACGLQWQDIDFKQSTAAIRRNLCYTPKKGVYIDTPKNDKSRVVDLGPDTLALLRQLRTEQASRAMSAFVFTQDGSPEPMHPTSPTHYFRQFYRRYGIQDFHPHKLRHTFASVAITAFPGRNKKSRAGLTCPADF